MKYTNLGDAEKAFVNSDEAKKLPKCIKEHSLSDKNHKFSNAASDYLATKFTSYRTNAITEDDDVFNQNVFELIRNAYMIDYYGKTEQLKNKTINGEDAIEICKTFLNANEGDDATTDIILSIFAELLDCSADTLIDIIYC